MTGRVRWRKLHWTKRLPQSSVSQEEALSPLGVSGPSLSRGSVLSEIWTSILPWQGSRARVIPLSLYGLVNLCFDFSILIRIVVISARIKSLPIYVRRWRYSYRDQSRKDVKMSWFNCEWPQNFLKNGTPQPQWLEKRSLQQPKALHKPLSIHKLSFRRATTAAVTGVLHG